MASTLAEDREVVDRIQRGAERRDQLAASVKAAETALDRYYVNKAIIGCKAFDLGQGTFEPHEREAFVKKKMRQNAEKVIVVADHTKFGKRSFVRTLACSEIDMLVTDEPLDKGDEETLEKAGVQVVYA